MAIQAESMPYCCVHRKNRDKRRAHINANFAVHRGARHCAFPSANAGSSATSSGDCAASAPARSRWLSAAESRVALPLAAALLLCNANRVCLSVAVVQLSLPLQQAAIIQSAFLYGYMLGQIPGGTLADSIGGKRTLACGIALFSLADACFPLAFPAASASSTYQPVILWAALLLRWLVGLGESCCMPTMNAMLSQVDSRRKSTAVGCAFSGFHSGTITGLLLSPLIIQNLSWRWVFYLFGGAGAPLLLLWLSVVPNDGPSSKQRMMRESNVQGTSQQSASLSLLRLFATSSAPYAIVIATVINHFGFFVLLNWIPTYFSQLGLNVKNSALLSVAPWCMMAVSSSGSGVLADACIQYEVLSRRQVRWLAQTIAFVGPAAMLICISTTTSPRAALVCFSIALTCKAFGQAGFVANQQEIAPGAAGKLVGVANTFGSLGGALGTWGTGLLVERTGSWTSIFYMMALLYVIGTLLWLLMCRVDPHSEDTKYSAGIG